MAYSPEFSVVIPTYDRVELLKEALKSVYEQTYRDYEIIVVDDGSTDSTKGYLNSQGDRVRVLYQANRGPGAARNLGLTKANGKYVAFLDSDDIWFPWTLATFHETIRRHQEPSLISASTKEFQERMPVEEPDNFAAEAFCDFLQTASKPGYVGSGAMVAKRSIFSSVGAFDEGLAVGEDLDFYIRAGTCRNFVRVLSPVTLAYRRHCGNISFGLSSLFDAALELLMREAAGRYPGGDARRIERQTLLSRMIRPVILACLHGGLREEAWRLYLRSFLMHIRLRRFRFLGGFALYGIMELVTHQRAKLSKRSRSSKLPVQ